MPRGNDNVTASPSGAFRTKHGLINIAANKQEQWEEVAKAVGHPEWIEDARFAERQSRLKNRDALKGLLERALATKTTDEWWKLFNAAGVPAGPVYTVPEALAHPQIRDRGMVGTFEKAPGVGRDIRLVRTGFKVNGASPSVDTPPPQLGEHTREILEELGYDPEAIRELKDTSAI